MAITVTLVVKKDSNLRRWTTRSTPTLSYTYNFNKPKGICPIRKPITVPS